MRLLYQLAKPLATLPVRVRGIRFEGAEHIPNSGPVILAGGNHQSNLDPLALGLITGRVVHYMAKKELFANPLIAAVLRGVEAFPVDRQSKMDLSAIRKALQVLEEGEVLGIFPQGTRGGTALLGGVAYLAIKGKAPVVPVWIAHDRRWKLSALPAIPPRGSVQEVAAQIEAVIGAGRLPS